MQGEDDLFRTQRRGNSARLIRKILEAHPLEFSVAAPPMSIYPPISMLN
jgi:hypothetical protein